MSYTYSHFKHIILYRADPTRIKRPPNDISLIDLSVYHVTPLSILEKNNIIINRYFNHYNYVKYCNTYNFMYPFVKCFIFA